MIILICRRCETEYNDHHDCLRPHLEMYKLPIIKLTVTELGTVKKSTEIGLIQAHNHIERQKQSSLSPVSSLRYLSLTD